MEKNIEFKVLMLGARRTGKSSILASMLDNFQKTTAGSDVTFAAKGNTIKYLQDKRVELQNVFIQKTTNDVWKIEESPTYEIAKYSFNMNIIGKSEGYTITFVDIPGEYINNEHIEEVQQYVLESCVTIVAIDTPHLIEENGIFNEAFNKVSTLYNLFISDNRFFELDKMILFVPLKCEKYYYEKRMDEVKNAIKSKYANIIKQLGNERIKQKVTMVIAPILTIGGVVFSHFGKNSNGLVETYTGNNEPEKYRPKNVYYKLKDDKATFSPLYCEQPLVYTLSYIFKLLKATSDITPSHVASKVKAIIIDKLRVEESELINSANFINDLGADSLDAVELIMEFEKEFGITIPDDKAEQIRTVGNAISYIENNTK